MRDVSPAPIGVLLIQLGTPDSAATADVRRYLREFLSDPRVLDIAAPLKALLLNAVILPFRPRRSAEAYEKIWTAEGSPLTLHTEALAAAVQEILGDGYRVVFGMRYQSPPLASAVGELAEAGVARIVVLPLFPQYASASTGSAVEAALDLIASRWNVPAVATIPWFYDDPGFIGAAAGIAAPQLEEFRPDHVLFSYHGLPEKQIRKGDASGEWCLENRRCCDAVAGVNRFCYRAQSYATSRALAAALGLDEGTYSTAFQSRLAPQKWIEPYTDAELPRLYERGVRRLAVLTPSFAADCLETLEEIGIRGREQWESLGGEELLLIPCVNAEADWARAIAEMIRSAA